MRLTFKRSFMFIFGVLFLFALTFLCACGEKDNHSTEPTEPEEVIPQNVEQIFVSYNDEEVSQNDVLSFYCNEEITLNQISISYVLENEQEKRPIENLLKHISVLSYESSKAVDVSELFENRKAGRYKVTITYNKSFEFDIMIKKVENTDSLTLEFNETHQLEQEGFYSFEFGTIKENDDDSYWVLNKNGDSVNSYLCAFCSKQDYDSSHPGEPLTEINVFEMNQANSMTNFTALDVGEYYVCVYKEFETFTTIYSNVCCLKITENELQTESVPTGISFVFEVPFEYTAENVTLQELYTLDTENYKRNLKIYVNGEIQTVKSGLIDDISGTYELGQKDELENFVATNGVTVLEENILDGDEQLSVGDEKYVVLWFIPENTNYKPQAFLVNLLVQKGEVLTPDILFVGTEDDVVDNFDFQNNEAQVLRYSYINDSFSSYYTVETVLNGLEGTTTFTLKDPNKYKFKLTDAFLSKLTQVSTKDNYEIVNNEQTGVLTVVWLLNQSVVNSIEKDVTLLEGQNCLIVFKFNKDLGALNNLYEFSVAESDYAEFVETIFVEDEARVKVKILGFNQNRADFVVNINVKTNYLGKIEISNPSHNLSIQKFVLEEREEGYSHISGAITKSSIMQVDYVSSLYKYYEITWTDDGMEIGDNDDMRGSVITLDLVAKNSFFAEELDENKGYIMFVNVENRNLEFSFYYKKLSPKLENIISQNPAEICVSKYEEEHEYQYRMQTINFESNPQQQADYENVLTAFDGLGYITLGQQLSFDIAGENVEIVYGKTTSISELHQKDGGYLVEFAWTAGQTLKNSDGTVYKNAEGNEVTFIKLDLFVDSSDEVASYKIYIKTYTSDSTSVYYTYTIYANVFGLYNLAKNFDESGAIQGALV